MPKHPNASEETAAMERQETMQEKPQDRFANRLKFTGCHRCGSEIGMQSVHRETLTEMTNSEIEALAPWHQALWDADCLYYSCPACNREKSVPKGFYLSPISLSRILTWRCEECEDAMDPDYAALAAKPEAATAGQDSRDSAGLEG